MKIKQKHSLSPLFFVFPLMLCFLCGCKTLTSTLKQFKEAATNKTSSSQEENTNSPIRGKFSQRKKRSKGYLQRGTPPQKRQEITLEKPEKQSRRKHAKNKSSIKTQASPSFKNIQDLKDKWLIEKTEKEEALESLKILKMEFGKKIFSLENDLKKAQAESQKQKDRATKAQFKTMEVVQEMNQIKLDLVSKKTFFNAKYPAFYEVRKGDSLWMIAEREKIYHDPYKWMEIFHANQNKISDQDRIYPGMVLRIPRYFDLMMSSFQKSHEVLDPLFQRKIEDDATHEGEPEENSQTTDSQEEEKKEDDFF